MVITVVIVCPSSTFSLLCFRLSDGHRLWEELYSCRSAGLCYTCIIGPCVPVPFDVSGRMRNWVTALPGH